MRSLATAWEQRYRLLDRRFRAKPSRVQLQRSWADTMAVGPLTVSGAGRRVLDLTGAAFERWATLLFHRWRPNWVHPLLVHPAFPTDCIQVALDTIMTVATGGSMPRGPGAPRAWSRWEVRELQWLLRKLLQAPSAPPTICDQLMAEPAVVGQSGCLLLAILTDPRLSVTGRDRAVRLRFAEFDRTRSVPLVLEPTDPREPREGVPVEALLAQTSGWSMRSQVRFVRLFAHWDKDILRVLSALQEQATEDSRARRLGQLLIRARSVAASRRAGPPKTLVTTQTTELIQYLLTRAPVWATETWALWGTFLHAGADGIRTPSTDAVVRARLAELSARERTALLRPFFSHTDRVVRTYALQLLSAGEPVREPVGETSGEPTGEPAGKPS